MREEYSENARRWYDKDPVLSRSMKTLEESDDETQIKVALNLIKIIIEHNMAYSEYSGVDEIIEAVDDGMVERGNGRWYDIDKTLRAAISMLENCPSETQKIIAKEMAKIVIEKIKGDKDLADEFDDEEFDELEEI